MTLLERAKELNNRLFHTSSHKDEEREELIVAALWEAAREENEACAQVAENSVSQLTANYNAKVWEVSKTAVRVAAKAIRSRLEAK